MHYVLFGGGVFALFAAVYHWYPKFTGRLLHEGWGKVHFWMTFVGFHLTFLVQHVLGLARHAPTDRRLPRGRRVHDPQPRLVRRVVPARCVDLARSCGTSWRTSVLKRGEVAGDDPWGGHTLEWWTTSPPPPENFAGPLPPIRSNRPVWDANHPAERAMKHARAPDRVVPARVFVAVGVVTRRDHRRLRRGGERGGGQGAAHPDRRLPPLDRRLPVAAVAAGGRGRGRASEGDELYLPHASVWPFGIGRRRLHARQRPPHRRLVLRPRPRRHRLSLAGFIRQTRTRS